MTDNKLSALPSISTIDDADLMYVVDVSLGTSGSTKSTYLNLKTQIIAGLQPIDADLSAVAALTGTGIAARSGSGSWVLRALVAPLAGLTITAADAVAGNPTFALANDLAAVEGLSGSGIAVRTSADTWTTRTIASSSTSLTVTNGDGVSGAPSFALAASLQALGQLANGAGILTNDGSGNLTWGSAPSGTLSGTLTAGRVALSGGSSTVTDSANLTFNGAALILGTDLGGSELVRINGNIRATGAIWRIPGAATNALQYFENNTQLWHIGLRGDTSQNFAIVDDTAGQFRYRITTSGEHIFGTDTGSTALMRVGGSAHVGTILTVGTMATAGVRLQGTAATGDNLIWMRYNSADNVGEIQAESQGVAYRDLRLQRYGAGVVIGTDPVSSSTLRVQGTGFFGGSSSGHASSAATGARLGTDANGDPYLALVRTASGTDAKVWDFLVNGSALTIRAINDAYNAATACLTFNRTGTVLNSAVVGTDTGVSGLFRVGGSARISSSICIGTSAIPPGMAAQYLSFGNTVGRKIDLYSDTNAHVGIGNDVSGAAYEFSVYGAAGPSNEGTIKFGFISHANPGTWTEIARIARAGTAFTVIGNARIGLGGAVGYLDTNSNGIELGIGQTTDNNALLDFHTAEGTYSDYSARVIRQLGANGLFDIVQRGTGAMRLMTLESAYIEFFTGNTSRGYFHPSGGFTCKGSISIEEGGEYKAGSIYSDANWGMIFRSRQASPVQSTFLWTRSDGTPIMYLGDAGLLTVTAGINMSGDLYNVKAGTSDVYYVMEYTGTAINIGVRLAMVTPLQNWHIVNLRGYQSNALVVSDLTNGIEKVLIVPGASGNIEFKNSGSYTFSDPGGTQGFRVGKSWRMGPGAAQGYITSTGDNLEIGADRGADGVAFIDFHAADGTYSDYAFRIIRNSGANGTTEVFHRGTGDVNIVTSEASAIRFYTANVSRLTIAANGAVDIVGTLVVGNTFTAGSVNSNARVQSGSNIFLGNNSNGEGALFMSTMNQWYGIAQTANAINTGLYIVIDDADKTNALLLWTGTVATVISSTLVGIQFQLGNTQLEARYTSGSSRQLRILRLVRN